MWRRTVDCLGVPAGITTTVPELEAPLDAVLRSYAEAYGEADLEYRLEVSGWPRLVRDGAVVGRHEQAIDLVAALELDLYAQVIERARGLVLHAGAVVSPGGLALVFAGRSGAGKSTLVRALLAGGFSYLSEECVALRPGGECVGLARALHVDDDRLPVPPGFRSDPYLLRRSDGTVRAARLLHPPGRLMWRGTARAVAVVAIEHADDAVAQLTELSGGEALAALWPAVFRTDATAVAQAAAILADVARFRLTTARPEQAVSRALSLAAELGADARG